MIFSNGNSDTRGDIVMANEKWQDELRKYTKMWGTMPGVGKSAYVKGYKPPVSTLAIEKFATSEQEIETLKEQVLKLSVDTARSMDNLIRASGCLAFTLEEEALAQQATNRLEWDLCAVIDRAVMRRRVSCLEQDMKATVKPSKTKKRSKR
jgi:hypothetical protein